MKIQDQLSIIIGIIVMKLVILASVFFLSLEIEYMNYKHILAGFCDLTIILFLYKFVKLDKQQNVSVIPYVMITMLTLWFVIIKLSFMQNNLNAGIAMSNIMYNQMLSHVIPSFIIIVAELLMSIQLINNKTEDSSRYSIKFVGYSFLFMIAQFVLFPIVIQFEIAWFMTLVKILTTLPLLAMIYMYGLELNRMRTAP